MIQERILLPRSGGKARQPEAVCGPESSIPLVAPTHLAWVSGDAQAGYCSQTTKLVYQGTNLTLDPANGYGQPSLALSSYGSVMQVGCDKHGTYQAMIDAQGYVAITRSDVPESRWLAEPAMPPDLQTRLNERRALFALRDATAPYPMVTYQMHTATTVELWYATPYTCEKVFTQPKAAPGALQGLTSWTQRPLAGAVAGGPWRRQFIFSSPDVNGKMQAFSYEIGGGVKQLTEGSEDLMAGVAFWRSGKRHVVCVARTRTGVGTGVRVYYEPEDGATPWVRGDDLTPAPSSLSAWQQPGGAQSPEVAGPVGGELACVWSVHERLNAVSAFAIGMYGCLAVGLIGRPDSVRLLTTPTPQRIVYEPEIWRDPAGSAWWVAAETTPTRVPQWGEVNPEVLLWGPITLADFNQQPIRRHGDAVEAREHERVVEVEEIAV